MKIKIKITPKFYLFGSIFSAIIVLGIIVSTQNSCKIDGYWMFLFFCMGACIFGGIKYVSIKGYMSFFEFIYLFTIPFLLLHMSVKITNKNIEKGAVIISAKIIDKWSAQYTGSRIEYTYLCDSTRNNHFIANISRNGAISKKIGDTILIIYAVSCPRESKIYKLFPSQEEVEQYKDGVFYQNGKIEER